MKRKDRKHSGRVYPRPTISKKALLEEDLVLEEYYDDWLDYRDSYRDTRDKTKIRSENTWDNDNIPKFNKKNKLLLLRRKSKKLRIKNEF